jgi:hypothetical protein
MAIQIVKNTILGTTCNSAVTIQKTEVSNIMEVVALAFVNVGIYTKIFFLIWVEDPQG